MKSYQLWENKVGIQSIRNGRNCTIERNNMVFCATLKGNLCAKLHSLLQGSSTILNKNKTQHATISKILQSYSSNMEISQLKYMNYVLIYGFHVTGQGYSHLGGDINQQEFY
jgi:hypothetical protein